ncbi:hypothetical protein GCM10023082_12490 [Streptomyces tremellae]|uniref:Uncharacterized protein n=1 Tax=Streptomyces tremellae TaxID=1124239 RepID=A0ABP7ECK7_9ACTN
MPCGTVLVLSITAFWAIGVYATFSSDVGRELTEGRLRWMGRRARRRQCDGRVAPEYRLPDSAGSRSTRGGAAVQEGLRP